MCLFRKQYIISTTNTTLEESADISQARLQKLLFYSKSQKGCKTRLVDSPSKSIRSHHYLEIQVLVK